MLQSYIGKTDWFFYILKVFILLSEELILHQTGLFWIKKSKNKNKNKKNTKTQYCQTHFSLALCFT